ncbi:hypothetical protein N7448_003880 [Penicillium atrosanguineum]|uniref:beta-glucosidase n=1 Tax=Penicillium atrosanguineum TaxID=1132637 RepID=A0A9W9L7Z1_9EURO|nr:hypothetical protein N7448_003880 [Penicillium atrosanguineum]KAJ5315906.1 hypothetical protein N7476_006213 [Penicillium atrosanguineum]
MGEVIGDEGNSKQEGLLLGPTVNLHRPPLSGRNFEACLEDPVLSGILAAAFVNGVQSKGVSTCPKHFVGNECETECKLSNTIVAENTRLANYHAMDSRCRRYHSMMVRHTEFDFSGLALKRKCGAEPTDADGSTNVTDTGSRSGREVLQIYFDGVLKGSNKVFLGPERHGSL